MLDLLLPWLPGYGAGSAEGSVAPPAPILPASDPVPLFGWPIYSDRSVSVTPTITGGAWRASLPLANLTDRRLARVARSVDVTTASTQFVVDLQATRAVRVLALVKHSAGLTGRVRWRAAASTGGLGDPLYDSGWLDLWPTGATREAMDGLTPTHVHLPPTAVSARVWQCELSDPTNPAGYLDVGRVVIAGGWTPSTGMGVGARLGLESDTERVTSDGGAAIYREKPVRRVWEFTVPALEEIESVTEAWRLIRQIGTSRQLFFVFDTADPYMHERAFLGVLRELSALEHPWADAQSVAFRLVEEL